MAANGPNKITLEDFIGFFEENSAVPDEVDVPFFLDYETEKTEGQPDPNKLNEDQFEFCCILTTKRLLQNAISAKVVHADSTYKMNWEGFPVHIFGFSDLNKQFHITGVGFSTKEISKQFRFCFKALREGALEIFQQDMNWMALMSDAAPAIKNAFEDEFPFAVKLTCYFHVIQALKRRTFNLVKNRDAVLKDVAKLRLSPNIKSFDAGANLFVKKWSREEKDFVDYFKTQWLTPSNKYWFAGAMNFAPSTNNCLESTNGKIKNTFNFRERSPMNAFKNKIIQVVRVSSVQYRDGIKQISRRVSIKSDTWNNGHAWAASKKQTQLKEENDTSKVFYIPVDTDLTVGNNDLKAYEGFTWKTFDQFSKNIFKIWVVMIPNDKEYFHLSTCTCPSFLKHYQCKHVLAMGIRMKKTKMPDNVKKLDAKPRKPGRGKKAGPALSLT